MRISQLDRSPPFCLSLLSNSLSTRFVSLSLGDPVMSTLPQQPEEETVPPSSVATSEKSTAAPSSTFQKVFTFLKDTKELIGIAVFFGAGILWVGGYFATKSQLLELRCLMQAQIDLARSETDFNAVRTDMLSINLQLDDLNSRKVKNGSLNALENQQFFDLSARLDDLKKQRATAQEKADHVRSDLDHNVCGSH